MKNTISFIEYQERAHRTAHYPGSLSVPDEVGSVCYFQKTLEERKHGSNILYSSLALAGEAGELCNLVKKLVRANGVYYEDTQTVTCGDKLFYTDTPSVDVRSEAIKELGDVLWYLAELATQFNITLSDVAEINLSKLEGRNKEGTISSIVRKQS